MPRTKPFAVALLLLLFGVATHCVASPQPAAQRLTPFDPQLEVAVHEFRRGSNGSRDQLTLFPRHQVPQVRRIDQPGALLIAVNVRELALLPGDRVVMRDATNTTTLTITANNQSIAKKALQRPRPVLWNHPFLMLGSRVTIEYWPSLLTLVLPINRKQLDNPVLVVDSYTYAFLPRRRAIPTSDDSDNNDGNGEDDTGTLESTVGARNEMRPAVCYKKSEPEWYAKARSVARLIIQRTPEAPPPSSAGRMYAVVDDDAIGDLSPDASDQPAGDSDATWTFCTGWLVGRGNHMLTNYHCFFELTRRRSRGVFPRVQAGLRHANADFVKQDTSRPCDRTSSSSGSSSGTKDDTGVEYLTQANVNFLAESKTCNVTDKMGSRAGEIDATAVDILAASEALDYCLLRLLPNQTANGTVDLAKKFGYLTLRESGPVDGEPIYIPQHPNGEPKTIASLKAGKPAIIRLLANGSTYGDDGTVSGVSFDNVSVWYNADTAPGSSGSPVISQRDNTVVALHHAGTGARPSASTSGGWWSRVVDRVVGGHDTGGSGERYNIGIRIDAVVADMRQRGVLPPCAVAPHCETQQQKRKSSAGGSATTKAKQPTSAAERASPCCESTW